MPHFTAVSFIGAKTFERSTYSKSKRKRKSELSSSPTLYPSFFPFFLLSLSLSLILFESIASKKLFSSIFSFSPSPYERSDLLARSRFHRTAFFDPRRPSYRRRGISSKIVLIKLTFTNRTLVKKPYYNRADL